MSLLKPSWLWQPLLPSRFMHHHSMLELQAARNSITLRLEAWLKRTLLLLVCSIDLWPLLILWLMTAGAARGVKVGGASGGNTSTSAVPKVESASAYGDGCFECGPASQFYKPGCHCENTLFVKRDAAPQACLPRSDCGPASQYYRPGCFCENTLFMKKRNAAPAANGCFECGPASVFYKPGCHCENTLFT